MTRVYLQDTELTGGAGAGSASVSWDDIEDKPEIENIHVTNHIYALDKGYPQVFIRKKYDDDAKTEEHIKIGRVRGYRSEPPYIVVDDGYDRVGSANANTAINLLQLYVMRRRGESGAGTAEVVTTYTAKEINNLLNKLNKVAWTGSYNDLTNRPTKLSVNNITSTNQLTTQFGTMSYENLAITNEDISSKPVYRSIINMEGLDDLLIAMSDKLYDLEQAALITSSTAITPGSGMTIVTGTYQPTVWKQGNVVIVEGAIRNTSARSSSEQFLIGTLPAEFKPANHVYRVQRCGTSTEPRSYNLHISSTTGAMYCGAILDPTSTDRAAKPANAQEAFYIGCSFIVNDDADASTHRM